MTRLVIAAVLTAALGPAASAQPAPNTQVPPVTVLPTAPEPQPGSAPAPNVFVHPNTPPGPAIPLHKSGGAVVGAYGYYPYDTGDWLLGGTAGTTRQSGSFTMVFPTGPAISGIPAGRGPVLLKHGFCRR